MSRSCHTTPKAPNAGLSFRQVSSQRGDRRVLPSSSQSPSAFPCINTGDRQVRGWMTDYPGTEDSQDPACRNLGSILQRSSTRARAVPGVSVHNLPPPLESVPSQAIPCSDRYPHVQVYLLLLGEQTDCRQLSDWRISASGFRHIGPFFTNSGFHTIRKYAHAYTVAGRISGLDTNAD